MKRPVVLAGIVIGVLALIAIVISVTQSFAADKNPVVVVETSLGTLKIELYEDKAPITVKNFLAYTDDKFFDGTLWHRVIPDFMIQGGGFEPGLKEKQTKDMIKNESFNGLKNERGTVAMARTPKADSATAQFFVNLKNNDFLDKAKAKDGVGYCVFGKVVEGMDVVDKIAQVETHDVDMNEAVPVKDILIKSVRRAK